MLPSSAATIISSLLVPSLTLTSPVPLTFAFESFGVAFIFTFSTPASASALYSRVSLLNSGLRVIPSISKDFRVASLLFSVLLLVLVLFLYLWVLLF